MTSRLISTDPTFMVVMMSIRRHHVVWNRFWTHESSMHGLDTSGPRRNVMQQHLITLSLITSLLTACGEEKSSSSDPAEPAGIQHSYVDVNGLTLHVVTAGQGEPVVL